MNYFAHGLLHVHRPYLAAGTAVPDWLRIDPNRTRLLEEDARRFRDHPNACWADLASGIERHLRDDARFHASPDFAEVHASLTELCRAGLARVQKHRPSVVAHILLELLLDAHLIEENPDHLSAYYDCLERVDPAQVQSLVNAMSKADSQSLARTIFHFRSERFLEDYLDDRRLCFRMNQVLRRARLPELPLEFLLILQEARDVVRRRGTRLLAAPLEPEKLGAGPEFGCGRPPAASARVRKP